MHPLIEQSWIDRIKRVFQAVELVLALHYASSSSDPILANLLDRASLHASLRINFAHFEVVLFLVPNFYYVYPDLQEPTAVHLYRISTPLGTLVAQFLKNLENRKSLFNEAMRLWLDQNPHLGYIPGVNITEITEKRNKNQPAHSPTKKNPSVTSNGSPSPTKVSKLKNDSSRFRFKERLETEEAQKSGLSLLERIRLKEKLKKSEISTTPEERYDSLLAAKLEPVYNILYQQTSLEKLPRLVLIFKLTTTVRDSFSYPISQQEVEDTLKMLVEILPSLKIVSLTGTTVVRVENVDRERDIAIIREKNKESK